MTDHRDFTPPRKRHSYLAVDEMRLLDWWCAALQRSFGKIPYLVGSALTRPDYDVPQPATSGQFFYVADDGSLSRRDPNQPQLPNMEDQK